MMEWIGSWGVGSDARNLRGTRIPSERPVLITNLVDGNRDHGHSSIFQVAALQIDLFSRCQPNKFMVATPS